MKGVYGIFFFGHLIAEGVWGNYEPPWHDGEPVLREANHAGPVVNHGHSVKPGDIVRVVVLADSVEKHTLAARVNAIDADGMGLTMAPIPRLFGVARATL